MDLNEAWNETCKQCALVLLRCGYIFMSFMRMVGYGYSSVDMVVADVLVPFRHQDISNHHADSNMKVKLTHIHINLLPHSCYSYIHNTHKIGLCWLKFSLSLSNKIIMYGCSLKWNVLLSQHAWLQVAPCWWFIDCYTGPRLCTQMQFLFACVNPVLFKIMHYVWPMTVSISIHCHDNKCLLNPF